MKKCEPIKSFWPDHAFIQQFYRCELTEVENCVYLNFTTKMILKF